LCDWLHAVAAAPYGHAGADTWTSDGATVHRVTGGFNNALYRVEADGQAYACKLCVVDESQRAAREYGALRLLDEAGLDIAPRPVLLDTSCAIVPFPAVVYEWLPGQALGPTPTDEQLAALLEGFHHLHSLRPGDVTIDLPDAWFHWFAFAPYVADLRDMLARYGPWLATTDPDGQVLYDRLARLVDGCGEIARKTSVDPGRERVPLRLCRVDHNLANAVWGADARLRWVDWEYCGWGDPAVELAELRWHASLAGLSEAQHAWIRDSFPRPAGDHAFEERLWVCDCLRLTRWPLLILRWLWSQGHGPDRVRLSRPAADPAELRARLVRFVERAERFTG